MKSILTCVCIVLLCCSFAIILGQQQRQYFTLYSHGSDNESNFAIIMRDGEPDLGSIESLNLAEPGPHYFCYVGGWTTNKGFNYTQMGRYLPYSSGEFCGELTTDETEMSSIRYAGIPGNASSPSLAFYEKTFFDGEIQVISVDTNEINFPFKSVYKSGYENWTLYTRANYTGATICVNSPVITNLDDYDVTMIRSAKKGCASKNVVTSSKSEAAKLV